MTKKLRKLPRKLRPKTPLPSKTLRIRKKVPLRITLRSTAHELLDPTHQITLESRLAVAALLLDAANALVEMEAKHGNRHTGSVQS